MHIHTAIWILILVTGALAALHTILFKRDPQAALGWLAVIIFSPILGAVFYFIFGLNRVRRKAISIREEHLGRGTASASTKKKHRGHDQLSKSPPAIPSQQCSRLESTLKRVGDELIQIPIQTGNLVESFFNGDQAYPEMLAAIAKAQQRVFLSSYLFNNDAAGKLFVEALASAQGRGVEVRVLIDDVGARYSFPSISKKLHRAGLRTARFLPMLFPWQAEFLNLRLHRKNLVVDGSVAFLGGMNILQGNLLQTNPKHPIRDIQFRVQGSVVHQCENVFLEDWFFATQENLQPSPVSPAIPSAKAMARVIADGPDSHAEKTVWMILAALSGAEKSVCVMTPYFFPDEAILMALANASLRGVAVDIVLPKNNNLPWVQWAANTLLWQILEHGCRVWLADGPFTHSKLLVVDQEWTLFGSSNWDRRSFCLNFELNMECFDHKLAVDLHKFILEQTGSAHLITLAELESRPFLKRLRDGTARLLGPLL